MHLAVNTFGYDTIDREIYHWKKRNLTGATHIAMNGIFMHLGVSCYPLNNAKKLKKATEKITNYFIIILLVFL